MVQLTAADRILFGSFSHERAKGEVLRRWRRSPFGQLFVHPHRRLFDHATTASINTFFNRSRDRKVALKSEKCYLSSDP